MLGRCVFIYVKRVVKKRNIWGEKTNQGDTIHLDHLLVFLGSGCCLSLWLAPSLGAVEKKKRKKEEGCRKKQGDAEKKKMILEIN
jgi:hypothetical protein